MIKIFKIARLELSILFYSPVAWLAIAIFMVQNGVGFFGMLGSYQEAISMGNKIDNLTFSLFPDLNGLFDSVVQNLYLYIPLITMGLMSRELHSGSIKLLLSSPVKIREIVLGKYLSMVAYAAILILILCIYSGAGILIIKNADVKLICSGLIGIFLLACTYSAIGLFMSSLTSYQVVAAISTLAVLAALRFVGSVGQDIDFIRDLTYFLSISGRAEDMLKGLITTREIFYFIIIIGLFLSLCVIRMKNSRESNNVYKNTSRYALLIVFTLFLGYISSRPGKIGYLDMTRTKSRTLTAASQEIAAQIDGPLEITTYVNLLDQNVYFGLPQSRNSDLAQFEKFQRFIPGIKMKYVYYYDVTDLKNNSNMTYQGDLTGLSVKQIAEKVADNMGLDLDVFMPPEKIRKLIDLSSENNTLVRVLRYKGKESRLRFYNGVDQFPAEREIAAAIKRLIVPVPQIAFITGNQERSIRKTGERNYELMSSMKRSRTALINQGFDIIELDLKKNKIPAGLSALVLADPSQPIDPLVQQKIAAYAAAGGNMLITTEPGRGPVINPILQMFGVALLPGTLVHPTKNDAPDLLFGQLTGSGGTVAMPGAAALKADPIGSFIADTLVQSNKEGWITQGVVDVAKTDIAYQPQQGDRKGAFPMALALHRKSGNKEQLILVSGDADFMSNAELANPRADNGFFVKNMFQWFSNGAFPIDIVRKAPADDSILLNRRQLSTLKGVLIGLIPALVILLGGAILIRRKNN
jgi:ABC-2 type transport system permease protein